MAGAGAAHEAILNCYPDAPIDVFIVWIRMLESDNQAAAERAARIFDDRRATQFYDGHQRVGSALADGLINEGLAWDIYLLYRPGARWNAGPPKPAYWSHQLGTKGGLDHYRTGVSLAQGLYEAVADNGFTPRRPAPTQENLLQASRRINEMMFGSASPERGEDRKGETLCRRCAAQGNIGQCLLSDWGYVIARKAGPAGTRLGNVEISGMRSRPVSQPARESPGMKFYRVQIRGLTCRNCIQRAALWLLAAEGVGRAEIDFASGVAEVVCDGEDDGVIQRAIDLLQERGFQATLIDPPPGGTCGAGAGGPLVR